MTMKSSNRERVSLCMIVRDEARSLARCLASAEPWAGELVVVDTGSTDDTVAIAEAHGARVIHVAWRDDFSAARNAALDAATRDWALVLDADETLVVDDPAAWDEALDADLDGYSLPVHNLMDDGQVSHASLFRLFRRDRDGMRYRGEIHEQVARVADGQARTAGLAAAHLVHDGYTSAVVGAKDKGSRNLALARRLAESRPEDPYAWYVLGNALQGGDLAEVIRCLDKGRAMWAATGRDGSREAFLANLYVSLVGALRAHAQPGRARETADEGLALFPDSPDLRYQRAQLRLQAEDFAGAAADLEVCLTPAARAFMVVLDPMAPGVGAKTLLALAWIELGRGEAAEALLRAAVDEAPAGFGNAHRLLGGQVLQRGDWAGALPLLERAFAAEPETSRFNLGWCLYKLERYEEAIATLLPLAERQEVKHLIGKAYLEAGQGATALELLESCTLPPAGLARGWAYYVTGAGKPAAACWEEWMRAGAADWGTKDALATFLFLLDGGRPPKGQPERPAEPLRDMDQWFRLLLRHKRFDEVERAVSRGPQLAEPLWRQLRLKWGVTLAKEGFSDVGLHLLLEARAAAPHDPEIYYWIGFAALNLKQVDDARTMWLECLRLAPGHTLAGQGLGLLESVSP